MVNSLGLCEHNNMGSSCPSCIRGKSMHKFGLSGGMGAECAPGYYNLKIFGVDTGQCAPNLSTLTSGAQAGVLSTVATGVATSPANIAAAKQGAISASISKISESIAKHPMYWVAGAGIIGFLVIYGSGKLAFGGK